MNERLDKAYRALDIQEKYSRRNNLSIHGIKEESQENNNKVAISFLEKENGKVNKITRC